MVRSYFFVGLEEFTVFVLGIAVRHAGDVVADDAVWPLFLQALLASRMQLFGTRQVDLKQRPDEAARLVGHAHDPVVAVQFFLEEKPQLLAERPHLGRERDEETLPRGRVPDAPRPRAADGARGLAQQVRGLAGGESPGDLGGAG